MGESTYFLRGQIDRGVAPRVRGELAILAAEDHDVVVDCAQLTCIDSCGVRVLLEANADVETDGHHLRLQNVPDSARRLIELLGVTDVLHVESAWSAAGGLGVAEPPRVQAGIADDSRTTDAARLRLADAMATLAALRVDLYELRLTCLEAIDESRRICAQSQALRTSNGARRRETANSNCFSDANAWS